MSSAGATDAPVDQSFTSISSDVSVLSWNILAECYFQEAREGGRSHSSFVTDKALIQWSQRLKVRHVVEVACPLRTAQTYPTTPAHCCGPDLASPPSALRTRPQHHDHSPTRVASPTNSHRLPPLFAHDHNTTTPHQLASLPPPTRTASLRSFAHHPPTYYYRGSWP